ncbi:hypothetical protein VTL71DRAFT_3861 [Oculimacula yallundae]|uniref:Transposase Tc1-like domain-containing protein n=1 Tax=Oculimacula yallundae TaxID=86028 RepID=A0ABR4C458_9HELO
MSSPATAIMISSSPPSSPGLFLELYRSPRALSDFEDEPVTPNQEYHRLSLEDRAKIHSWREFEKTPGGRHPVRLRTIAQRIGCSLATAGLAAASPIRFAGTRRVRRCRFNDIHKRRILTALKSGSAAVRRMTFTKLAAYYNVPFSASTIRKFLKSEGYRRCKAICKPWLLVRQKANRLDFALRYKHLGVNDWVDFWAWTDQSQIQNGGDKDMYMSRRPFEAYLDECLRPSFARPPQGVHIEGVFCGEERMPLITIPKGTGPRGGMTAQDFITYVAPNIVDFVYA